MNSRAFKTSSIVIIHECYIYFQDDQEIDDSCILKKNIWSEYNIHLTNPIIVLLVIQHILQAQNQMPLRHGSPHNLHNLAKWHLKRIVLISRHET